MKGRTKTNCYENCSEKIEKFIRYKDKWSWGEMQAISPKKNNKHLNIYVSNQNGEKYSPIKPKTMNDAYSNQGADMHNLYGDLEAERYERELDAMKKAKETEVSCEDCGRPLSYEEKKWLFYKSLKVRRCWVCEDEKIESERENDY